MKKRHGSSNTRVRSCPAADEHRIACLNITRDAVRKAIQDEQPIRGVYGRHNVVEKLVNDVIDRLVSAHGRKCSYCKEYIYYPALKRLVNELFDCGDIYPKGLIEG